MLAASPRGEEATGAVFAMAEDSRRMTVLLDRFDTVRLGVLEAEFLGDGSVRVSAQKISPRHDGALAARLFGAVGAGEAPADDAAAAALAGALDGRRATLSGALVAGVGRDLFFMREPAAVLGRRGEQGAAPIHLAPGARCLWDRRFTVENSLGAAAEVRPLGAASRALKSGPIEALATAPGLWRGGELAAFPGDDGLGDASISCLTAERFHRRVVRH
jgi:tRNA(Ile)-lysidine synthase